MRIVHHASVGRNRREWLLVFRQPADAICHACVLEECVSTPNRLIAGVQSDVVSKFRGPYGGPRGGHRAQRHVIRLVY